MWYKKIQSLENFLTPQRKLLTGKLLFPPQTVHPTSLTHRDTVNMARRLVAASVILCVTMTVSCAALLFELPNRVLFNES